MSALVPFKGCSWQRASTSSQWTSEDQEEQQDPNDTIDDDGVNRRPCSGVNVLPVFAEGEAVIAGVGEGHAAGGDHAGLAHEELDVLVPFCIIRNSVFLPQRR